MPELQARDGFEVDVLRVMGLLDERAQRSNAFVQTALEQERPAALQFSEPLVVFDAAAQDIEVGLRPREISLREPRQTGGPIEVRRLDAELVRPLQRVERGIGLIVAREEQDQAAVRPRRE